VLKFSFKGKIMVTFLLRTVLLIGMFCVVSTTVFAQNNVGIGTTTPHASSILELNSTSLGFLLPRMTAVQKTAIASPSIGLMIFQTDAPSGPQFYDGTVWRQISFSTPSIIKSVVNQDITSIPANSVATITFTVTGAVTTASAIVSPGSGFADGLIIQYARVSATNTVEIKVANITAGAIDPPAMDFLISVIN
jgi:hypothetical protein